MFVEQPGPGKGTLQSRPASPQSAAHLHQGTYTLFPPPRFNNRHTFYRLLFAAFHSVMSSADAASVSAASSPPTTASLSPSSPGTGQVDPPSELHAPHTTQSTHDHSPTDAVSAVLDTRVDNFTSDVCESAFMIVEGESQDDTVDDAGHENVDVQGREGVMVMDNGDEGQQWFPEHENHELKRVKVRLILWWLSAQCSFPSYIMCLGTDSLTHPVIPKVYELINSRWVDQGTALCFGQYEDGEAALVAKAEANMSEIILKTTIRSSDVYQRQQGSCLVLWLCFDQYYTHQVRVQIPSLSGQSRMASTMRSAFRIPRVAWNCGTSYLRCRVYARIAVVRVCSIWTRTQRLKNRVYNKIIQLNRPLRWQDLSHRSPLQASSAQVICPNLLWELFWK